MSCCSRESKITKSFSLFRLINNTLSSFKPDIYISTCFSLFIKVVKNRTSLSYITYWIVFASISFIIAVFSWCYPNSGKICRAWPIMYSHNMLCSIIFYLLWSRSWGNGIDVIISMSWNTRDNKGQSNTCCNGIFLHEVVIPIFLRF